MKLHQILPSTTALLALVLTGSTLCAGAQDKKPAVNPTGTWEFKTLNAKGQPPQILKLTLTGGKLTGTLSRNAGSKVEQLPLEDAKLKGSEISFATHVYALVYENNVLQPTDTNKVTHSKFQGQISGDTIQGKVEKKSWREEESRTLDWQAKRVNGTTR
jgi:hypothetical protein